MDFQRSVDQSGKWPAGVISWGISSKFAEEVHQIHAQEEQGAQFVKLESVSENVKLIMDNKSRGIFVWIFVL